MAALKRMGYQVKSLEGSHLKLFHPVRNLYYTFAFNDSDEIGPTMLAKISKKTGLKLEDL